MHILQERLLLRKRKKKDLNWERGKILIEKEKENKERIQKDKKFKFKKK